MSNVLFQVNPPYTENHDDEFTETVINSYLEWFREIVYGEPFILNDDADDEERELHERVVEFIENSISQIPDYRRYLTGSYAYSFLIPTRYNVKIGFIAEVSHV